MRSPPPQAPLEARRTTRPTTTYEEEADLLLTVEAEPSGSRGGGGTPSSSSVSLQRSIASEAARGPRAAAEGLAAAELSPPTPASADGGRAMNVSRRDRFDDAAAAATAAGAENACAVENPHNISVRIMLLQYRLFYTMR